MHHEGPANSYKPETHPAFELTGKDRGPRPLREIPLRSFHFQSRSQAVWRPLTLLVLPLLWVEHLCSQCKPICVHMNVGKIMVTSIKHHAFSQVSKGCECLCFSPEAELWQKHHQRVAPEPPYHSSQRSNCPFPWGITAVSLTELASHHTPSLSVYPPFQKSSLALSRISNNASLKLQKLHYFLVQWKLQFSVNYRRENHYINVYFSQ